MRAGLRFALMVAGRLGSTIGIAKCGVGFLLVAFVPLHGPAFAEQHGTHADEARTADPDPLYAAAEDSYRSAAWRLAVEQFDCFWLRFPRDSRASNAQFYAAEAEMQCRAYTAALTRYRDLIERRVLPDQANRIRFRASEAALLAGSVDAARADLEAYVRTDPSDPYVPDALILLAQAYQLRGEYDAALVTIHRLLEQYANSPQVPVALLAAGQLHGGLQQHVEAQRVLEQLIHEYPDDPRLEEAVYQLGLSFEWSGNSRQAAKQWVRIQTHYPTSPHWCEVTYLLAQAAFERGDYAEAETLVQQWLEHVVRPDPGPGSDPEPEADRFLPRVLYLQARIAAAMDRWHDVAAPLEQLIVQWPDSPFRLPAQFWIAEANFRNGHYGTAARQFEQLELLVTGRDANWVAMIPLRQAQIHALQNDWGKAYRTAQSIRNRFHDFELLFEVDYVLGRCLANLGEMAEARKMYRRVIESSTGKSTETAAMAQWMIGETYMHQKDFQNAIKEYMRVLDYADYRLWRARAALQVGVCHERMHQWDSAAGWYASAASEYADTPVGALLAKRQDQVRTRLAMRKASSQESY